MFLVDSGLVAPPGKAGRRRKYGTGRNRITEIGDRYGVSHVTLYKAAYVHAENSGLAKRVLNGDLSVAKAEAELKGRARARIVDADGKTVPPELRAVFATRQEFGLIENHLRSAKESLERIKIGLVDRGLEQAETALQRADRLLKRVKPHVTCPDCRGNGCPACRNRGWLSEIR
jgi:hypothetical protein